MALTKIFVKNSDETREVRFTDCLLDSLGVKEDACNITLQFQNNCLTFSISDNNINDAGSSQDSFPAMLKHHPTCPLREINAEQLSAISENTIARGIAIAAAVLVQSSDNFVLLTRRASHMRTFPDCWVPPGGHVDPGESLTTAVARELAEEIGLEVDNSTNPFKVIGVWESVYPPLLQWGLPNRHHIIVYFLYTATESRVELQEKLRLNPEEVFVSIWLTPEYVQTLLSSDMSKLASVSPTCEVTVVNTSEAQRVCEMPVEELFSFDRTTWIGTIARGTTFALERWLIIYSSE